MQVGGIGSGLGSHESSHHVTNCIHEHNVQTKEPGAMRLASAAMQPNTGAAAEQEKEMSLFDALRGVLSAGKRLLGHIWGGDAGSGGSAVNGSDGENAIAAAEQVMAQIGDASEAESSARVAAASTAVQAPRTMLRENPYFTAADPAEEKENFIRKIRVKFRDIAGQMTQRFGGTFSGRGALSSGRQQPKEDLRKHSRYRREDGLEIDCVLTDDSYLLDSYDRRGEYSKLTTEIKKN